MSDPQYQIDLERVGNDPVSAGIHTFKITSFTEGEGEKGAYWKFDCECETPSEKGKSVPVFLSLTPQSRWKLEIFLDAVNAPKAGAATADKFIGRRFRGSVEMGEYNGRPQAKINEMFPVTTSSAPTKTAEAPAAKTVVTKKVVAAPAKKVVAGKKTSLPADSGDEIPF